MDPAKATVEGTTYARMVHSGALSKERRPKIFLDRDFMEWRPGKFIGAFHLPLGIAAMEAEDIFVGKAEYRFQAAVSAQGIEEFKQRVFSLAADHKIDVLRIQSRIGIDGWKI